MSWHAGMGHRVLIALLLLPGPVLAQRDHHEEHDSRHEFAVFVGATLENEEHGWESAFTFGAEYEFRFLPRLGVSVEFEHVDAADAQVFAFPAVLHVHRGLMVVVGPGWETSPRERVRLGDESRFLIRTGVQYSFHVGGRFSVMPAFDIDFVRKSQALVVLPLLAEMPERDEQGWETLVVFGVKLGWSF